MSAVPAGIVTSPKFPDMIGLATMIANNTISKPMNERSRGRFVRSSRLSVSFKPGCPFSSSIVFPFCGEPVVSCHWSRSGMLGIRITERHFAEPMLVDHEEFDQGRVKHVP